MLGRKCCFTPQVIRFVHHGSTQIQGMTSKRDIQLKKWCIELDFIYSLLLCVYRGPFQSDTRRRNMNVSKRKSWSFTEVLGWQLVNYFGISVTPPYTPLVTSDELLWMKFHLLLSIWPAVKWRSRFCDSTQNQCRLRLFGILRCECSRLYNDSLSSGWFCCRMDWGWVFCACMFC